MQVTLHLPSANTERNALSPETQLLCRILPAASAYSSTFTTLLPATAVWCPSQPRVKCQTLSLVHSWLQPSTPRSGNQFPTSAPAGADHWREQHWASTHMTFVECVAPVPTFTRRDLNKDDIFYQEHTEQGSTHVVVCYCEPYLYFCLLS